MQYIFDIQYFLFITISIFVYINVEISTKIGDRIIIHGEESTYYNIPTSPITNWIK